MVENGTHTEDLILATLRHGRKRQKEIIALLNRNESTVRRHLKKLVETGQVKKEKEDGKKAVFYFLPTEERLPIEPLPSANADEVSRLLFRIKGRFGLLPDQVLAANVGTDFNFYDNIIELHEVASNHYFILRDPENLDSFFEVFDLILENIENVYDPDTFVTDPDLAYELFIMTTSEIYSNWQVGKEAAEFHLYMSKRADRIQELFQDVPTNIAQILRSMLILMGNEHHQRAYIQMVESGSYSQSDLLKDAYLAYDSKNEYADLDDDLNDLIERVDEEDKQRIKQLKQELQRLRV